MAYFYYLSLAVGQGRFTMARYVTIKNRKVRLDKPFRTPNSKKKFGVYVENNNGSIVLVRFGDPNMEIKRDNPKNLKNFRSRHDCKNKTDKTKAGYWSCKMWEKNRSVSQVLES